MQIVEGTGLMRGKNGVAAMKRVDEQRIRKADKPLEDLEKKIRQKKHVIKRRLEDQYEEEEGNNPSYNPRMY